MINAYKSEEESFLKTVKPIFRDGIPDGANVVNSHFLQNQAEL